MAGRLPDHSRIVVLDPPPRADPIRPTGPEAAGSIAAASGHKRTGRQPARRNSLEGLRAERHQQRAERSGGRDDAKNRACAGFRHRAGDGVSASDEAVHDRATPYNPPEMNSAGALRPPPSRRSPAT